MQQSTFSHVQTHFNEMCHRVIEEQDVLLVTREDSENVVMMSQSLFEAWQKQAQQTLTIPKLNPLNYAKAPTEPFHTIAENKAELVFADIEDSAAFAKKLRQQAWQRHE
jgi:PHD/YefM family antitoxin component YafN of YafNO toxin-antitoxin module